jgi:starch synthase (maltosyl-transferring)
MRQAEQTTLPTISPRVARDSKPGTQPETTAVGTIETVGFHRVIAMDLARSRRAGPKALLSWIVDTGFDTILLSLPPNLGTADIASLPPIAGAAREMGLHVQLDLVLDVAGDTASAVKRHPEWYRPIHRHAADPRQTPSPPGLCVLDLQAPAIEAFAEFWASRLRDLSENGINFYRCKLHAAVAPTVWQALIAASPQSEFSAWTPGITAEAISQLPPHCFNSTYNSLAWWDFGAGWLHDEAIRLAPVAPAINTIGLPAGPGSGVMAGRAAQRLLEVSACNGCGLMLPMGVQFGLPSDAGHPSYGADDWQHLRDNALLDLTVAVREANQRLSARDAVSGPPRILSSDDAPVAVLFQAPAQLTIANRHLSAAATFEPSAILPALDGTLSGLGDAPVLLAPGEVRVFTGVPAHPVVTATASTTKRKRDPGVIRLAAASSRVAIEAIQPAVDDGRFAVKRIVGERVTVEADIFADGHGKIAAALQWRARDENDWREAAMLPLGNDRWSAHFPLERVGPYVFRVVAWPDRFETWRDELTKKHAAGLDVALELEEGKLLVEAIDEAAPGTLNSVLAALKTSKARKSRKAIDRIAVLTDAATAALVARVDPRPGQAVSGEMPIDADRRTAEFASWYELFPRNQSDDLKRHGTFIDVVKRLPAIRDMGFDVLYFPPIHPIGRTNRKGRDNTMTPAEDDPGSPYAIGAAEGGHEAIHPELGTLDDFRTLRDEATKHGLELALDFAVQCSPDHPWLREHPEWFDWRPDGGLRYAENPPKKYEDIVNVDFYRPEAIPALWLALRDVVAYWAKEGIRIFRVDNPHTKPLAFWEWLIADIRAIHPDALFLAEAFTRPKLMYRLAKLGFSQSYTYFTWRNEKWEIEAYMRELTMPAPVETAAPNPGGIRSGIPAGTNVSDFFRPNFFVNTPDINPVFLQHAGRAGFLIRAALAATLSGLWGMLQGYEFCEATPVPGREEYASSDKYEIRVRPERAAGDIVDEITRLNAIRRANPALQSHRGLAFHNAWNDRFLWYRKANVDRSNVVLIAISLDPFSQQTADVEVPLWEWGLDDNAALIVDDLMGGGTGIWRGKNRTISLNPHVLPFAMWRARPLEVS